jgi:serine/threonine protein kinase/Tol biopolymer transport system component
MLKPGSQLGPYEIVSQLGRGGMGEVYRAKDTRLGREVAVKVLPKEFTSDQQRLRYFEQEARSASALNHPNIITIYEIGQADAASYIAMELVEGKTLREILGLGPLPTKKMLHVAVQVADGLAKAHAAGIVHRDLKPENLMVTKDGLVKILDFGLAKLVQPEAQNESGSQAITLGKGTESGVILGTAGYMSPEQASGLRADFRSDQFSFGAILYEMATGKRAFQRGTAVETLSAIIRDEPEPIAGVTPKAPAPFRWIVERCLAKSVEDRYASTRDLARDLQSLREHVSEVEGSELAVLSVTPPSARRRRLRIFAVLGLTVGLLAALTSVYFLGRRTNRPFPTFSQLTFGHGNITAARFAADDQTVIYGASWVGKPPELYTTRPGSPESGSLGLSDAGIFSISPSGEMAIAFPCAELNWGRCMGTLAQVPPAGGAPRQILEKVHEADWAPDGKTLAVAQFTGGQDRLQYPIGKVLYETSGWVSSARVSPKGGLVAFLDYPIIGDISGSVCVVDLTGKKRTLSPDWKGLYGLAWTPAGDEIWFSGSRVAKGGGVGLHAVTLSGRERVVFASPGALMISDISRDGRRALVWRGTPRAVMISLSPGAPKERDLSWFDYSTVADLSADGKTLLFYEWGVGAGGTLTVYLRKTDGSDAVRLGEGKPLALSPDAKWALALQHTTRPQLIQLPTGPGERKPLPRGAISVYFDWAAWSPDGNRIFFAGAEPGHRPRTYVQDVAGGEPRPITAEGMTGALLSPDGKLIAAVDRYGEYYICPVDGSEPRAVEGLAEGDALLQMSSDDRSVFVRGAGEMTLKIYKLDLSSGRRQFWKELTPPYPAGLIGIGTDPGQVRLTPDGKYYVYTSWTFPSELYLAQGLK